MAVGEDYRRQVQLLMQVLPFVADEKEFALKGGTAINLFIRNMPRLSVDIDLTFLPVAGREESLAAIKAALLRIKERIEKGVRGARVAESRQQDGTLTRLIVQLGRTQIKIEVTPVLRGGVRARHSARGAGRRRRVRVRGDTGRLTRRPLCRQDYGGP